MKRRDSRTKARCVGCRPSYTKQWQLRKRPCRACLQAQGWPEPALLCSRLGRDENSTGNGGACSGHLLVLESLEQVGAGAGWSERFSRRKTYRPSRVLHCPASERASECLRSPSRTGGRAPLTSHSKEVTSQRCKQHKAVAAVFHTNCHDRDAAVLDEQNDRRARIDQPYQILQQMKGNRPPRGL